MKNLGLSYPPAPGTNQAFDQAVATCADVEESSHTPQGAYGYLLSQIDFKPRLSIPGQARNDVKPCSYRNHVNPR